jgi:hypothetical protein
MGIFHVLKHEWEGKGFAFLSHTGGRASSRMKGPGPANGSMDPPINTAGINYKKDECKPDTKIPCFLPFF